MAVQFAFAAVVAVLYVATFIANSRLAKETEKNSNRRTGSAPEFNRPTVTSGRRIPVLFGTDRVRSPNIIFTGNVHVLPLDILFNTQDANGNNVTTPRRVFRYAMPLTMGICRGPVVFRKIWLNDKLLWSGTMEAGSITVREEDLLGSPESGGDGDVSGIIEFAAGTDTQTADEDAGSVNTTVDPATVEIVSAGSGYTAGGANPDPMGA